MEKPRWMSNADMKLRFEAEEAYQADRSTRGARMRSFPDDERTRMLGGGGNRVRIDVPALTTDDLKQAVKELTSLTKKLGELAVSSYKRNDKIMLMRTALSHCNSDLNSRHDRARISYKRP